MAGVGQPIENVGFAGSSVTREAGAITWRALVKNHGTTPQQRAWHLEIAGTKSPTQSVEIAAGALTEISAQLPAGAERD